MPRLHKRGAPRHLERTLFINHKEDQMLDTRLNDLTLQSRLRSIELDRERSKVRNEWRNSRKKQITISEAIAGGLIPETDTADHCGPTSSSRKMSTFPDTSFGAQGSQRVSISAPSQRPHFSRSSSVIQSQPTQIASVNQFTKKPSILNKDEYDTLPIRRSMGFRRGSTGSVGLYVLEEFQKMSEVVPGILRALAKKKEQQEEADERSRLRELKKDINVEQVMENLIDYEPDMNKVRKTVSSVKNLRHRMAMSKRLERPKQTKSLDQMIKEKADNIGEHDQFTDGTCALMKRRLEKKRRESVPFAMEPGFMSRRGSAVSSAGDLMSRRSSVLPEGGLSRRGSNVLGQLPLTLTRSATTLSLNDEDSPFIDEDVLVSRQRVMNEWGKYRVLKNRVDDFLVGKPKALIPVSQTVTEEIIPIKG